jgi:Holliday junction DNA helicase RuvA
MIAKLKGVVDSIGDDYLILDVGGVGYLVFASAKTLGHLNVGNAANLLIETVVREDSITLFGFVEPIEKEWFITLTKVQGVGAKVGLSILSALSVNQLRQAVSAQDKNMFTMANGVGPKLAARIVTELKDKIVTVPMAQVAGNLNDNLGVSFADNTEETNILQQKGAVDDPTKMEDAISALVNLGYQRIDAYRAVNQALIKSPDAEMGELIKLALKEFVKDNI